MVKSNTLPARLSNKVIEKLQNLPFPGKSITKVPLDGSPWVIPEAQTAYTRPGSPALVNDSRDFSPWRSVASNSSVSRHHCRRLGGGVTMDNGPEENPEERDSQTGKIGSTCHGPGHQE